MKKYKLVLSKFQWRGEKVVRASILPAKGETPAPITRVEVYTGKNSYYTVLHDVFRSAYAYGLTPADIDNTQANEFLRKEGNI